MKLTSSTLGEICDEVNGVIQTGPFGSQLHESDYVQSGIPVVMPKNIVDGRVSTEDIAHISEEDVRRLHRHKLRIGDIVYGRRGDIGRRALIAERENGWFCGTGCLKVGLGETVLNPTYLYYYLGQASVINWIANQAIGATMPNLNTSILRSVPITYPPLSVQKAIAATLSAYDNLIENNTRRIEILEEMAQMLYREWFVNLRFPWPGKERMGRTNIARLPDGWTASSVGFLAEDVRRSVDPAELDPETPYIGLEHMPRQSIALSEWGAAKQVQSTKLKFYRGEILFGKIRPYFHKVGLAPVDGVCSSDAIVIVPKKEEWLSLVLCCVSSGDFVRQATQTSQGTKMPRANWDVLARYPVALPKEGVLRQFNDILTPILDLIRTLIFCNRNLKQTRDLLLPRLISGEVSVEHPETEPATQIS
jgi:type I restriction enzyme S subunit